MLYVGAFVFVNEYVLVSGRVKERESVCVCVY